MHKHVGNNMRASFRTYNKPKGFNITWSQWLLIILTILYVLFLFLEVNRILTFIIGISWLVYFILFMINNVSSYEKVNGSFSGRLILDMKYVSVNNAKYFIEEIERLDISNCTDFEGRIITYFLQFSPYMSNGLDNEVIIELKNGEKIRFNFEQTKNNMIANNKDLLEIYFENNIIISYQ